MAFPEHIKEEVLVASGRCCALCHHFCGLKIELHHIKQRAEGGTDTFDNCIPLCFNCHADMRSYDHKHPKGTKYTEQELKRHRNEWYAKVKTSLGIYNIPDYAELDKQLYRKIRETLAWDGVIFGSVIRFSPPWYTGCLNPPLSHRRPRCPRLPR